MQLFVSNELHIISIAKFLILIWLFLSLLLSRIPPNVARLPGGNIMDQILKNLNYTLSRYKDIQNFVVDKSIMALTKNSWQCHVKKWRK